MLTRKKKTTAARGPVQRVVKKKATPVKKVTAKVPAKKKKTATTLTERPRTPVISWPEIQRQLAILIDEADTLCQSATTETDCVINSGLEGRPFCLWLGGARVCISALRTLMELAQRVQQRSLDRQEVRDSQNLLDQLEKRIVDQNADLRSLWQAARQFGQPDGGWGSLRDRVSRLLYTIVVAALHGNETLPFKLTRLREYQNLIARSGDSTSLWKDLVQELRQTVEAVTAPPHSLKTPQKKKTTTRKKAAAVKKEESAEAKRLRRGVGIGLLALLAIDVLAGGYYFWQRQTAPRRGVLRGRQGEGTQESPFETGDTVTLLPPVGQRVIDQVGCVNPGTSTQSPFFVSTEHFPGHSNWGKNPRLRQELVQSDPFDQSALNPRKERSLPGVDEDQTSAKNLWALPLDEMDQGRFSLEPVLHSEYSNPSQFVTARSIAQNLGELPLKTSYQAKGLGHLVFDPPEGKDYQTLVDHLHTFSFDQDPQNLARLTTELLVHNAKNHAHGIAGFDTTAHNVLSERTPGQSEETYRVLPTGESCRLPGRGVRGSLSEVQECQPETLATNLPDATQHVWPDLQSYITFSRQDGWQNPSPRAQQILKEYFQFSPEARSGEALTTSQQLEAGLRQLLQRADLYQTSLTLAGHATRQNFARQDGPLPSHDELRRDLFRRTQHGSAKSKIPPKPAKGKIPSQLVDIMLAGLDENNKGLTATEQLSWLNHLQQTNSHLKDDIETAESHRAQVREDACHRGTLSFL